MSLFTKNYGKTSSTIDLKNIPIRNNFLIIRFILEEVYHIDFRKIIVILITLVMKSLQSKRERIIITNLIKVSRFNNYNSFQ